MTDIQDQRAPPPIEQRRRHPWFVPVMAVIVVVVVFCSFALWVVTRPDPKTVVAPAPAVTTAPTPTPIPTTTAAPAPAPTPGKWAPVELQGGPTSVPQISAASTGTADALHACRVVVLAALSLPDNDNVTLSITSQTHTSAAIATLEGTLATTPGSPGGGDTGTFRCIVESVAGGTAASADLVVIGPYTGTTFPLA